MCLVFSVRAFGGFYNYLVSLSCVFHSLCVMLMFIKLFLVYLFRYDRNFVPNVSLAVEPFDELHKLRQDDEVEEDFATDDAAVLTSVPLSHRTTHLSSDVCHSENEDDDTESVSSDKCKHFIIVYSIVVNISVNLLHIITQ